MDNNNLAALSRRQLARLGREYMAAGQFIGRTGYAALRMRHGDESYRDVAIDNWMYVSPIYTQRMQRAMDFVGDDVATIFKGLQLEVGFAHQYFKPHFVIDELDRGRFWLESCGPLLETEPRGDAAVKTMCHDIEDPTFDATAVATNPRARMRPAHRPPRAPTDRTPHCEWVVFIDHDAEPLVERDGTRYMRGSQLAGLVITRGESAEPGGMDYYDGPVQEVLQLEQLSHAAQVVVCKELALQFHLLIASLMLSISERYGRESADAAALFQMTGSAWVISERLGNWLEGNPSGIDRLIDIVRVHPAFQPAEYIALQIEKTADDSARLQLGDCPASREIDGLGWFGLLQAGETAGLEALLAGIDPRVRLAPLDDTAMAWDIKLDSQAEVIEEPLAVQIGKGTVLYRTQFEDQLPLLQVAD